MKRRSSSHKNMTEDVKSSDKQDKISACVNFYLKRRGYSNEMTSDPIKKVQKFVCNKDELLLNSLVDKNIGSSNSVALNSLTSDPAVLLLQFNKFDDYIKNNSNNVEASELDGLLFPILLHAFADLIGNGYRTSAVELVKQRSNLFPKKDLLRALTSGDEKTISAFLTEIKNKKFKVSFSNAALEGLLIFLKEQDNLYLLQILNRYVDITVLHEDGRPHSPKESPSSEHIEDPSSSKFPLVDSLKMISSKLEAAALPPLPSVHLTKFNQFSQGPTCSVMSSDEMLTASGCEDSDILVCHLCKSRPSLSNRSDGFKLKGHFKSVLCLDFFPHSRWLISGSHDKTVRLWDVEKRNTVVVYSGHTYHVNDVSVCSVGPMFASCSYDQTAKLWSTDRIFPLRSFLGHMQSVNCIACHPNSNYLATGSSDMTVRLWSVQDGRSVRLMLGHQGRVDAVAFSPDGKYLASAGEDMAVKVWDLGSGSLFKNFVGHTDHVYSLAFNKHCNVLASGSMDGNICLWGINETNSASSSQPLASFPTNSSCVMHLKFGSKNVLYGLMKQL